MIKGINRQMIEIDHIDSCYFDRALLIMKPDCTDVDESLLRGEATRLSEMAASYSGLKRLKRRRLILLAVNAILFAVFGFLIGQFVIQL